MADMHAETVRLLDRDRYIATLFAPDDKREDLFTLYALALELQRIPQLVSEPQIGEIRLQWWLDTLTAAGEGTMPDHPLALDFARVMQRHALPVSAVETLINARRDDLYADTYPSLESLEGYIAETEAVVMQLACLVLDPTAAGQATALIGPVATAFGLARLAARNPLPAKFIPEGESVTSLRALAATRLKEARQQPVPPSLLPALLPSATSELYLNGNPSALRRQWTMWRSARRNTI